MCIEKIWLLNTKSKNDDYSHTLVFAQLVESHTFSPAHLFGKI